MCRGSGGRRSRDFKSVEKLNFLGSSTVASEPPQWELDEEEDDDVAGTLDAMPVLGTLGSSDGGGWLSGSSDP